MGAVPVFSTIANPNQEIQQQREPTENQAVSSNAEEQVDDEDSDVEESNHPAFGNIPDNSIPGLLGHPASETPLVCEDPSLKPHGLTWTHVESISMDECTAQPKHTVINFPMGIVPDVDNIYSMWSLFFPYCIMDSCIKSTSERLQKKKYQGTTENELEKWFGITLARTLFERQGRDLWRSEFYSQSCCLPAAFGIRYGMSRNRYDEIQSCLQFGTFSDEQLLENPWLPVQCFIDGFNATRVKYVNPGTYLLIDEIMSPWLGLDADYAMNGVPHRTKIERKPKGIGVELKAVCDCMSSIMMQLEICEGALRQSQKKYEDQYGSGTAVTLRMTSSWHGKAHIVVGDSAFSSVATAVALKQNGTYFVGIVKTASKMYPKQFMQTHHFEERGAHIALSATVQCNKVFAVSWLDGKRKDLVSTCGTTLPASPAQRTRQQVVVSSTSGVKTRPYIRYTPRCNIVASFFDNFHKIDVHDHLRQGVLKLEQHWLTKNWVHRLFATLIGVVATDCYFASKLLYPHQMSELPFLQYIDKLAFQLINNELYSGRCTRSSTGSEASSIIRPAIHTLKPIHTLPEYSKKQNEKRRMSTENCEPYNYRARRRCVVCGTKAASYCDTCYVLTGGTVLGMCNSGTGRDCLAKHITCTLQA